MFVSGGRYEGCNNGFPKGIVKGADDAFEMILTSDAASGTMQQIHQKGETVSFCLRVASRRQ